jgi:hypothetical protein
VTVVFRRPQKQPREFQWLRWTLWAAFLSAIVSLVRLWLFDFPHVLVVVNELREAADALTAPEDAIRRDLYLIAYGLAWFSFLVIEAVFFWVVVRYAGLFWKGLRVANPMTLASLQRNATMHTVLNVMFLLGSAFVFGEVEVLPTPNPLDVGLVTAPLLLWLTTRPAVRVYFSSFDVAPIRRRRVLREDKATVAGSTRPAKGRTQA